jgi:hypothetical protein
VTAENFDILVTHMEGLSTVAVQDFQSELRAYGTKIRDESYPEPGPQAGLLHFSISAIAIFIAAAYVEGLIGALAADHLARLQKALKKMASKYIGPDAPQMRVVSTKGKVGSEDLQYSMVFAIYGELGRNQRCKLLFHLDATPDEVSEAIDLFVTALLAIHAGTYSGNIEGLDTIRRIGGTVLVALDRETRRLKAIDPIPASIRH